MKNLFKLMLLVGMLAPAFSLSSQQISEGAIVKVTVDHDGSPAPGETVNLEFEVTPQKGWHVYSVQPSEEGAYQATELKLDASATQGAKLAVEVGELGKLKSHYDDIMQGPLRYFDETVTFFHPMELTAGNAEVVGTLHYMGCNDEKCIPFTADFSVAVGR